jgi:hypothetical protein
VGPATGHGTIQRSGDEVRVFSLDRPGNFAEYFRWISKFSGFTANTQVIGVAALCWTLWKHRNMACFEKKLIKSPAEIICYACSFLRYWAGLSK